ncbi:arylsulfatase [Macrococcus hajekii]|uniref:Arylsulfatase n=1 Tax=Macrococcus hajekii TaxID=198482 RepID=A0A4R6BJT7_9STAP|nr:arylsulfatase [Macrococcus hajekii]TDM01979.1 arylsulfatase [Macrococcus hajekii]GGB09026.1 arylsulfatase [Macrococcus hajekii]
MTQPNIILLFADDLGIGDVSAFNPEAQFNTLHIDRLAQKGIRFTDSHATSSLCTPSRYGLLTGRYNWRSRLKSFVIPGDSATLIEKNRLTLPQFLKKEGYNTAAIGKWHLGMDWTLKEDKDYALYGLDQNKIESETAPHQSGRFEFGNTTQFPPIVGLDIDYSKPIQYGPLDFGFDYFYGTAASLDQGPFVIIENDCALGEPVNLLGNPNITRVGSNTQQSVELSVAAAEFSPYHVPDNMQKKALDVLDGFLKQDEPFFLYYPNHLVHGPILPAERFKGKSGIGDYGDFVLQLDSYVGELIDKLEEYDAFNNTLFIFTSDNGVSSIVGLDDLKAKGHDSSAGYRGHKMHIWEGGHREPTIITYPDLIKAGQVSNHVVSHSDIFATIAELLQVKIPEDAAEDSFSNLSLWKGEETAVRRDIIHSSGNGGFSIRRDNWKLILVEDGGLAVGYDRDKETYKEVFKPTELYNIQKDISEQHNIIDDHPDVVKELTAALADYVKKGRSTEGATQMNAPDCPTGDWEQLAWMDHYEDYVASLNSQEDQA